MRLFKLLVTLVILCLIGIFIYQNMQIWTQPVSFKLNLYFNQQHDTEDIEQYTVILLSVLLGFIIGLALLLRPHIRTRRLLKRERQEKRTLQEQFTVGRAGAESSGETAAAPAEKEAVSEKEE
jgi:uncharacterized integral membrane protein